MQLNKESKINESKSDEFFYTNTDTINVNSLIFTTIDSFIVVPLINSHF